TILLTRALVHIATKRACNSLWVVGAVAVEMADEVYLAPDVFVCVTEGYAVFLDLTRDNYSAVRLPEPNGATSTLACALASNKGELLQAGVLTTDGDNGRSLDFPPIQGVDGHILGLDDQRIFGVLGSRAVGLDIKLDEIFDFLAACWQASRDLQDKHISVVVS